MTAEAAPDAGMSGALLQAARQAGLPARAVQSLERLSGGASKETWAFELVAEDGSVSPLVLRREAPGKRFAEQGLANVSAEARIVELAARLDVPVPRVAFVLPEGSAGGDGFAMERIEGETIGSRVLRLPELADARAGLAYRCGEVLGRLHGANDREILDMRRQTAREALVALDERHRATGQDRPVFELALRWLRDNLPDERGCVLLHGDFRNGNLVVGPEGLRAVLDWELSHVGPAAYDLAWLCVGSWRFQRPDLPVGGFGTREDLLAGYRAAGGRPIDASELFAWEVFQTMHWGVMCAGAANAFMEGSRTVEGGVIARRASETEFDLMRMLANNHEAWSVR